MGTFSFSHWLVVALVILIVFGAGRLPRAMGDLAKGIRSFRHGMREDDGNKAVSTRVPPVSSGGDKPCS